MLHKLRYEAEIKDLRQTVEHRQHDIDQLTRKADRLQQLVTYQKTEQAKLRSELVSAQAIVDNVCLTEAQLKVSTHTIAFFCEIYKQSGVNF
jgi:predicted RNase H-like nuclease (RuvC/YqgF family)